MILDQLGYRAAEAVSDGQQALEALGRADFDLVLMDCQMPGMDGYEATRLIRDSASAVRNHRVPIVAMTAHAMAGDRARCLDAGMDDYIAKPVHSKILKGVLERWLPAPGIASTAEDSPRLEPVRAQGPSPD